MKKAKEEVLQAYLVIMMNKIVHSRYLFLFGSD